MDHIKFLEMLLALDYNFQILTEDDHKVVITQYGKYYIANFTVSSMMNVLIYMEAQKLIASREK